MRNEHEIALIIRGDGSGGVQAVQANREELDRLRNTQGEVRNSSRELADTQRDTEGSFDSVAGAVGKAAGVIGLAVGAAATLAATMRTEAIKEAYNLADALDMSTSALLEWQYAGSAVSITGDQMGAILKDANEKIGEFSLTGGGSAADVFEGLNLQMRDFIGLTPDERLLKVAEALSEVEDAGQRSFYLESLGSDATLLGPLLENNAALLREMQTEARVLGLSVSDIDAARIVEADRAMTRVGGLMTGLANDITIELAPVLGGISDLFVDSAVEAGGFGNTVRTVVDGTVTGVGVVLDTLQSLRILLNYSQVGWLGIGQAGSAAMASVADSTAAVINGVMFPFQQNIAFIIEKLSDLVEFGAKIGGPFADEFKQASEWLGELSGSVSDFRVSADDIVTLNETITQSLLTASQELEALKNSDAPSDELAKWVDDLRTKTDEAAKAQTTLKKSIEVANPVLAEQTKKTKSLTQQLEDELSLLKITNESERRVEISLRKLGANATAEQKNEIRELTLAIYEEEAAQKKAAAAIKATEKATKDAAKQADPYAKAWESATERIDESFANAWKGAFDSFDDFADSLLDSFKTLLAEMAHQALTKKILVNVGIGGSGGGATSANSVGGFSLQDGVDLFNPSSGGVVSGINNTAYKLGYGSNPALSNNVAAIKNGDFSSTLINPNGYAAQGLNAIGPGLSAYGFAQQYGTVGGVVGGAGSAALAGGVSGALGGAGFLSGASGALAGLGPLGWAAIIGGALLGGKKPSDKTQSQAIDLDSFESTYSGLSGKKFNQENLDNSTGISSALSTFAQLLEQKTQTDFAGGLQVTTGGRDGQRFLYSPDGIDTKLSKDTNVTDNDTVITGSGSALLQSAAVFLAETAGIDPDVYLALANEHENLVGAYVRLESQVDLVGGSLTDLDIPTASLAENALAAANEIIAANGGLETYSRNQGFVNANFISAETRRLSLISEVQGQLDEWNSSLIESGQSAVDSKDDFLTYIRAIDQTTEAGRALYATALELAPALVAIVNEAEAAAISVEKLAEKWATPEQKLAESTTQLALFNAGLGLVGDGVISTRAGLLDYIDTLNVNTVAGRGLVSAALEVAPAIDALGGSVNGLAISANTARDNLSGALQRAIDAEQADLTTLQTNLTDAAASYNTAIGAQISTYNTQISHQNTAVSHAQGMAKTWADVSISMGGARAEMLNQLSSGDELQTQQKARFDNLIEQAKGFNVDAFQQLPGAAKSYQQSAAGGASSSNELRILTAEIAGALSLAQGEAASNQTEEQKRAANAARQTAYLGASVKHLQGVQETLQTNGAQALTLEAAAAAYRTSERELTASNHDTTLKSLTDELESIQDVNESVISLSDARAAYEQSQLESAGVTNNVLGQSLSVLQSINNSINAQAIGTTEAVGESLPQFANGGIATGPTSGYRVELHGTEAVIPLRGGAVPVRLGNDKSVAELQALNSRIAQLIEINQAQAGQLAVLMNNSQRADIKGMKIREVATV